MKEWRQKAEPEEMKALLESNDRKEMSDYLWEHEPETLEDFEIYKALSNKEFEMGVAETGYDPKKRTVMIDFFDKNLQSLILLTPEELHLMNLKTYELKVKGLDWQDRDSEIYKMVKDELKAKQK